MDLQLLYTKGENGARLCKLCDQDLDADWHLEECPGLVLDKMTYEIRIDGANCGRGCCGYTHESVEADTLEGAIEQVAVAAPDCVYPSYSARLIYDLPDVKDQVNKVWARIKKARNIQEAEEKARREAQARVEAKKRDLERLELERPDLTSEAYGRRKAEIEARS
jgi:hypothetical protein